MRDLSTALERKRDRRTGGNDAMSKVNLKEKLALFSEHWSPRIVGELNGQHVKLAKLQGEFVWHHHEHEDELFFVVKGSLTMRLREGDIVLNEGEFLIVPRGVEHQPVAEEEVHILLFEPASTLNTGNVSNELTVEHLERS
jgi:mannose-6-phosphate isomerase-like protein (cupin superfamily)